MDNTNTIDYDNILIYITGDSYMAIANKFISSTDIIISTIGDYVIQGSDDLIHVHLEWHLNLSASVLLQWVVDGGCILTQVGNSPRVDRAVVVVNLIKHRSPHVICRSRCDSIM